MQRFLIPIILISLTAWAICTYMLFLTPPQDDLWVILFLATLFVSIEMTAGLVIHALRHRFRPHWQNRREILRESLVLALPPSLATVLFLLLRYLAIDLPLNTGTLLLLSISLEAYLIKKLD